MRPDLVAPVVLWLCHDTCTDNGSVIEAAAGWVGKCESIVIDYHLKAPVFLIPY